MDSPQVEGRTDVAAGEGRTVPADLIRDLATGSIRRMDLKERPGSCRVVRVYGKDGGSWVVKMWNRPGLRGLLRRLSGTAPHQRESRCLTRLRRQGVSVPEALSVMRVAHPSLPFTDALVLQDLGECEIALEHVKRLVRAGRQAELDAFLESIVELTAGMVEAGVIDRDHSFLNVVARPDGSPARLDLEIAQDRIRADAYGEMLGRLVATLIFALQPDAARVTPFVTALIERLRPARAVIDVASETVEQMLSHQRRSGGPDTRIELPWR